MPLLVASIAVIAWKGPRLLGFAGFVTGFGLLWLVLLLRVQLTCGPAAVFADPGCESDGLSGWLAAAATIFCAGLTASAFALRRSRREAQ